MAENRQNRLLLGKRSALCLQHGVTENPGKTLSRKWAQIVYHSVTAVRRRIRIKSTASCRVEHGPTPARKEELATRPGKRFRVPHRKTSSHPALSGSAGNFYCKASVNFWGVEIWYIIQKKIDRGGEEG
jgi:hypothetical protein